MKNGTMILFFILTMGTSPLWAEVGLRYEDSVKLHGKPVGKMLQGNQVVYIFGEGKSTVREVYNLDGICIKSDFYSTNAAPVEVNALLAGAVNEPEQEPATEEIPVVEALEDVTGLVAEVEPAPVAVSDASQASGAVMTAVAGGGLAMALGAVIAVVILLKRNRQTGEKSFSVTKTSEPVKFKANDGDEKKVVLSSRSRKEGSIQLSRNELSFYKVLQKVVKDMYFTSFHVELNRLADLNAPGLEDQLSVYKNLQPVYVDFILHDTTDTSIAAVILLHDPKCEDSYRINRRKLLHDVFKKQGIPLVEVSENYKYELEDVEEVIFRAGRRSAA